MGRLGRFADGLLEASWLAAVVLVPLFLDKNSSEVFEPAKAGLLVACAVTLSIAWLIKKLALQTADQAAAPASLLSRVRGAPLAMAALAWLAVTLIACAFSLSPSESFWGHRGRAHGVVTLLALVTLSAGLACNLSTGAQQRRLLSALIAPSVPIALYAIFQRYGLEPLHTGGRETEAQRVTSLLGQPVYLAAYLGMVMPFTLLRVREAFNTSGVLRARGLAAHGILFLLQLTAFVFSESRGPLLGLGVAAAVAVLAVCALRGAKKPVIAVWVLVALGAVAISLRTTEQLKQLDPGASATRAAETFAVSGGGGQFRKTNWEVAARVLRNAKPLELADGSHDAHAGLHRIVGFGPEVAQAIASPFYSDELPKLFDYFLIERFHNQLWDVLLTTGPLGLATWLALQSSFFYAALRALGLLTSKQRRRVFWLAYAGSATLGVVVAALAQGLAFAWLGLQVGAVFGVALFVSGCAFVAPEPANPPRAGVLIATLAAFVAHAIETSFSFPVIATSLLFWILLALVAVSPQQEPASREDTVADGCVLAWTLVALGFAFIGGPGLSARAGSLLWDSLTLVAQPEKRSVPVFALLAAAALVFTSTTATRTPALRWTLTGSFGIAALYWLYLASALATLASPASTGQVFEHNFAPRSAATSSVYVCCLLIGLAFAAHRARGEVESHAGAGLRVAVALLLSLFGVAAVARLSLRPAHADAAAALGEAFKAQNRIELVEQAYDRAQTLLPHETFYTSQLAKAYVRQARVDAAHGGTWLDKADATLRAAIARAPAVSENVTNLALVTAQRTHRASGTPADALRGETVTLYQRALRLNPMDPSLWRLWAGAQLALLNNPLQALESANHAAFLERPNAATFAMIGEVQLALARARAGETRMQSLMAAASAFQRAKQLAPQQPAYDVSSGKAYLAAGQPSKAAESFRAALAVTPTQSRDRGATMALLKRAESELAQAP